MAIQRDTSFEQSFRFARSSGASAGPGLVTLCGELDLSRVEELKERLADPDVLHAPAVRVDLRRVSFVDSVIIGVIVTACKRARAAGSSFSVVCNVDGIVRNVFEIDGLVEYLEVEWSSPNPSAA